MSNKIPAREIEISKARLDDLAEIVAIYNEAVLAKFATADTEQFTVEHKQNWFIVHDDLNPIYVARHDKKIIAWISISPYRAGRMALKFTKEISYYVQAEYHNMGIGSLLIQHAIQQSNKLSVKNYIAIVLDKNDASKKLLENFGFQVWGHLPGVAEFDVVQCGHLYYGLKIG